MNEGKAHHSKDINRQFCSKFTEDTCKFNKSTIYIINMFDVWNLKGFRPLASKRISLLTGRSSYRLRGDISRTRCERLQWMTNMLMTVMASYSSLCQLHKQLNSVLLRDMQFLSWPAEFIVLIYGHVDWNISRRRWVTLDSKNPYIVLNHKFIRQFGCCQMCWLLVYSVSFYICQWKFRDGCISVHHVCHVLDENSFYWLSTALNQDDTISVRPQT